MAPFQPPNVGSGPPLLEALPRCRQNELRYEAQIRHTAIDVAPYENLASIGRRSAYARPIFF